MNTGTRSDCWHLPSFFFYFCFVSNLFSQMATLKQNFTSSLQVISFSICGLFTLSGPGKSSQSRDSE